MLKKIANWIKEAASHSRFRVFAEREWLLINFNEGGSKVTFYLAIYRDHGLYAASSWMLRTYLFGRVSILPGRLSRINRKTYS